LISGAGERARSELVETVGLVDSASKPADTAVGKTVLGCSGFESKDVEKSQAPGQCLRFEPTGFG
jgi:hypothetical protein